MSQYKISISTGNKKMGAIPSVSLPPIITCPKGAPCAKKCYAAKLCRIYPSVKNAYNTNLNILNNNPVDYWQQVRDAARMTKYFRYHVSGDIPDTMYLAEMVTTAEKIPGTTFLAFTKQYQIVNTLLDAIGHFPNNLKIIFSAWGDIVPNNPHNLPISNVIFKGTKPAPDWKICGGNCSECACQGVGCWELKQGETIAFYEH